MTRTVPKGYFMKINQGFYSIDKLYKMLKSENYQWLFNLSERLIHNDMYVYNYSDTYCFDYGEPRGYSEYFYKSIGGM